MSTALKTSPFLTIPLDDVLLFLKENKVEKPRTIKAIYKMAWKTLMSDDHLVISSPSIEDFVVAYNNQGTINQKYQTSQLFVSSERELRELSDLLGLSVINKTRLIRILGYLDLLIDDGSIFDLLPKDTWWIIGTHLDGRTITTFRLISKRFSEWFKPEEIIELLRISLHRTTALDLTFYDKKELAWLNAFDKNKGRIASGQRFDLVIFGPDKVKSWGVNEFGQRSNGKIIKTCSQKPQIIPGLTNIKMVVAGSAHSLALEHQGRVFSWGLNESGQLGISDAQLILGQDQIGLGHTNNVPLITQVPGLTKITKIWATINGSLALNDQGQVYEWGSLVSGSCSIFPLLLEMERVVTISPRWDGCLFLTSTGSVRGFGANQNNRMGLAGPGVISLPIPDKIIDLCLSQDHSWFLTDQGEVYVLGNLGPLTQYSEDHRTMLPLRVPELTKIISMISTPYDMIFIDSQRKALTLSHYNTLAYLRGSSHLLQISPHHFINFQFGSNFCPLFLNRAGKLLENLMSKLILLGEAEVY